MGTKRSHSDMSQPKPHSADHPKPYKRPRPHDATANPYQKFRDIPHKSNPINPLKTRIRSLKRLLANESKAETMGADVRIATQRELASLNHDLAEAERSQKRRVAIGKWHMVRFFDRRKAERRLKSVKRRIKEAEAQDDEELKKELHCAQIDLNYTLYCPLELSYSSLWPRSDKAGQEGVNGKGKGKRKVADADEDTSNGKDNDEQHGDRQMWLLVEKCTAENRLEQLRRGEATEIKARFGVKQDDNISASKDNVKPKDKKSAKKTKNASDAKSAAKGEAAVRIGTHEESDESDGGFFE